MHSCSPITPVPMVIVCGGLNPRADHAGTRGLVRARTALVEARTAASNQLWAILAEHWPGAAHCSKADIESRAGVLDRLSDPQSARAARRKADASTLPSAQLSGRQVSSRTHRPTASGARQREPDRAEGARSHHPRVYRPDQPAQDPDRPPQAPDRRCPGRSPQDRIAENSPRVANVSLAALIAEIGPCWSDATTPNKSPPCAVPRRSPGPQADRARSASATPRTSRHAWRLPASPTTLATPQPGPATATAEPERAALDIPTPCASSHAAGSE